MASNGNEGEAAEMKLAIAESVASIYRRRISLSDGADEARAEARESGRIELELRLAGIEAERAELQAMLRRGDINDHTARKLFTEITFSEAILKGREPRD
ncbi:hypothetical protein [Mesorhizobium sp. M2E.F.Ca.ET.209.01.1.1]|uniref:hypothetical protein n=1 Tax=Mesorhizobium sp. M2E.F.Ca.ET.209.01.1.1 TaxID=2500526 RepID=UPI001FEF1F0C|nr:hypothetical protein [Mesorhizobium sp. M2E.F.Ca.ET.209.01.1.1]